MAHIDAWAQYGAPEPGYEEQVYFFDVHADAKRQTRAMLRNAHGTLGASLIYNADKLPCFTQWKNTTDLRDGYVTGLEPGTNFPNPRTFEGAQGRVAKLGPGQKTSMTLGLEFHDGEMEVGAAEKAVQQLAKSQPEVHKSLLDGWTA